MGKMKKDIAMMAQIGFNHVRFAALGEVSEDLQVNIPFTSAIFQDIDGEKPVTVDRDRRTIHNLTNGGILVLH